MKLNELDLINLIPQFMKNDEAIKALVNGVNPFLRALASKSKLLSMWNAIDDLEELELDNLAWEMSIDWYDQKSSIEAKRAVIKQSDLIHSKRGTKWAVEQLITIYFGDGKVREWFEYDGEPYSFKVMTSNTGVTTDLAEQFTRAIEKTKNARSWLDAIVIALSGETNLFYGLGIHEVTKETHYTQGGEGL